MLSMMRAQDRLSMMDALRDVSSSRRMADTVSCFAIDSGPLTAVQ